MTDEDCVFATIRTSGSVEVIWPDGIVSDSDMTYSGYCARTWLDQIRFRGHGVVMIEYREIAAHSSGCAYRNHGGVCDCRILRLPKGEVRK